MKKENNTTHIQRLSKKLRIIFTLLMYLVPILTILFWVNYNNLPSFMEGFIDYVDMPASLPLNSRALALLGSAPLVAIEIMALNSLRQLFALYENGVYFQAENVKRVRILGKLAFLGVVADVIDKSVQTLAFTLNNPPGERIISIGFTDDHLKLLVVAAIINLIAMVMDEGRKNQDELQMTV